MQTKNQENVLKLLHILILKKTTNDLIHLYFSTRKVFVQGFMSSSSFCLELIKSQALSVDSLENMDGTVGRTTSVPNSALSLKVDKDQGLRSGISSAKKLLR